MQPTLMAQRCCTRSKDVLSSADALSFGLCLTNLKISPDVSLHALKGAVDLEEAKRQSTARQKCV